MGQTNLIDTNIIFDALDGKMPLNVLLKANLVDPIVSAVTYIEALGWHKITESELQIMQSFMDKATILPMDQPVVEEAVRIKQQKKIGLGDAIIAATAIIHNMVLVTRDVSDFKSIENLTLFNPWE
jgi:predicted nucleic acid-binding protein